MIICLADNGTKSIFAWIFSFDIDYYYYYCYCYYYLLDEIWSWLRGWSWLCLKFWILTCGLFLPTNYIVLEQVVFTWMKEMIPWTPAPKLYKIRAISQRMWWCDRVVFDLTYLMGWPCANYYVGGFLPLWIGPKQLLVVKITMLWADITTSLITSGLLLSKV